MVNTRSKTDALKNLSESAEVLTKGSGSSATRSKKGHTQGRANPPTHGPPDPAGAVEKPETKRRRIVEGETSKLLSETPARRPDDGTLEALPMDIILEILSYLHPLELLQLARTTRIFRNLLMSKNSRHIWRAARVALDINVPECPPDQSEPQWARLVLDPTCSTCDATGWTRVEWGLRVRMCSACLKEVLIFGSEVPRAFPGISNMKDILDSLPFAYHRVWSSQGQHKPPISTKRADRQYYRPAIQPTIDFYRPLRERVLAKALCAKEELKTVVTQKKQNVTAILDAEGPLKSWGEAHARLCEHKRREEVQRWQMLYRDELIAMGHHELDARRAAAETSDMSILKAGWEQNRAFFEDVASRVKGPRIVRERSSIFHTLWQSYRAQTDKKAPIRGLWPYSRDLLDTDPQIKEIIESGDGESYQDELTNIFPIALDRWWQSKKEILVEKIFDVKRPAGDPEDGRSGLNEDMSSEEELVPLFASAYTGASGPARQAILELAKSVFACSCRASGWLKNCPIYWDGGLLDHRCSGGKHRSTLSGHLSRMELDALTSSQVDAVCAALSLNADQARFVELDELDARFRCVKCPYKSSVMNWRAAIKHRHERGKMSQRFLPTFAKISDEEAVIVRAFELDNPDRSCPLGRIRSPLCNKAFYTTGELLDHLKDKHNQNELTPGSYWIDPSVPLKPVLETDVFEE